VTALANDPALLEAMAAGDAPRVRAVLRRQGATDLLLAVTDPDARVLGVLSLYDREDGEPFTLADAGA
jgi:hypothetical protein